MSHLVNISIPEPCSENWDGMALTHCGRFCASCQKEVIDLSKKSTPEILQVLKKRNNQACVRLAGPARDVIIDYYAPCRQPFSFRNFMVGFMVFIAFQIHAIKALAQKNMNFTEPDSNGTNPNSIRDSALTFRGKISDSISKQSVEQVEILVYVNGQMVANGQSDENGIFNFIVSRNAIGAGTFDIHFLRLGYKDYIIKDINAKSININIDVLLVENSGEFAEVVVHNHDQIRYSGVIILRNEPYQCINYYNMWESDEHGKTFFRKGVEKMMQR